MASRARIVGGIGVVGLVTAALLEVGGCSSFGTATEEPALFDAPILGFDAAPSGPGDDAGGEAPCEPLIVPLTAEFDGGFGELLPLLSDGGALGVDGGVLVATVDGRSSARAVASTKVDLAGKTLTRARVRFTLKGFQYPVSDYFFEAGCVLRFEDRVGDDGPGRSEIRLELRSQGLVLDDVRYGLDGSLQDSGTARASVPGVLAAADNTITIEVVPAADGGRLSSTAWRNPGSTSTKETPLEGRIDFFRMYCGINNTSHGNGANVPYTLALDDVTLELCGSMAVTP